MALLVLLAFSLRAPACDAQDALVPEAAHGSARLPTAAASSAPDSQSAPVEDAGLQKEIAIGRKALEQIQEKWPLVSDPAVIARLTMILNRLEPYMERRLPYEVHVVKTEAQNAFCLPGGQVFFTTGILDLLKTDSELAAVMAHEMVHADQRHGLRMAAVSNKVTLAALAAMVLSAGAAAPMILAQVAQVAITNSYTMELEVEADSRGLDALIASGYPPSGMVTLMEKFQNEELRQPIRDYGIYMNHPDSKKRIQSALRHLKERGIPVQRKAPLGILRTGIQESAGRTELTLDGVPVWGGKGPSALAALEKAQPALDAWLQFELSPYDIHLVGNSLYIGNHLVAKPAEGMDGLDGFRQNLLKALDRARRAHPVAKYFNGA